MLHKPQLATVFQFHTLAIVHIWLRLIASHCESGQRRSVNLFATLQQGDCYRACLRIVYNTGTRDWEQVCMYNQIVGYTVRKLRAAFMVELILIYQTTYVSALGSALRYLTAISKGARVTSPGLKPIILDDAQRDHN